MTRISLRNAVAAWLVGIGPACTRAPLSGEVGVYEPPAQSPAHHAAVDVPRPQLGPSTTTAASNADPGGMWSVRDAAPSATPQTDDRGQRTASGVGAASAPHGW